MKCRRKRYPICLFISDGLEIAVRRLKKNAVTGGVHRRHAENTDEMDGRKRKGKGVMFQTLKKMFGGKKEAAEVLSPVSGSVVPLSEVNDPAFAQGDPLERVWL